MRRLVPATLVALLVAAGCGREPAFPDRTARVTWGDRTLEFALDACGLDGRTAFLVGRAESGATLQAVVGVEEDGETGQPGSTGITVMDADVASVSAFGDEAWSRRGEEGEAPGSIETARIRGARIQAAGQGIAVDEDERPTGGEATAISLDARCDAEDDG